jgi:hypothetical protein
MASGRRVVPARAKKMTARGRRPCLLSRVACARNKSLVVAFESRFAWLSRVGLSRTVSQNRSGGAAPIASRSARRSRTLAKKLPRISPTVTVYPATIPSTDLANRQIRGGPGPEPEHHEPCILGGSAAKSPANHRDAGLLGPSPRRRSTSAQIVVEMTDAIVRSDSRGVYGRSHVRARARCAPVTPAGQRGRGSPGSFVGVAAPIRGSGCVPGRARLRIRG